MSAQHNVTPVVINRLVCQLQAWLPGLLAVYGFGSRVQGTARPDSDLDMAVLLAPACSSYDQYPNYLRRGEDFKRVVHEVLA